MFSPNVTMAEVNTKQVAWYSIITSKSVSGKTVFDFQSIQAPYVIRESNRFAGEMLICTNKATGETGGKFCTLKSGWEQREIIGYKLDNQHFYYAANWQAAKDGKLTDITTKVQELNFVAPPYFLLALDKEVKEGKGEKDIEGEGLKPQDQPSEYETSGKIKPFGSDESGLIETPLALLIPDFLHINSSWFDGSNPELSKKFNRFLLLLIAAGVVAYGRKKRVARRTARRTAKRVTA